MRTSDSFLGSGNRPGGTRRPDAASSGGFANGFLTLPTLSKKIPSRTVSNNDGAKWLKIAHLCAELVDDDELDIDNKTPARDIVAKALSAWASKHCADIRTMDGFKLFAALDVDSLMISDYYGNDEDIDQKWFVALCSEQTQKYFNVKEKIEALEKAYPGLGRTAVFYAEQASFRTIQMFSPSAGLYHGSHLYWCGVETDEDLKEEMEAGEAELDEEAFLPSQYKAAFPALFFTGRCLKQDVLQTIAAGNDEAAEVARVVLSIKNLDGKKAALPGMSGFDAEPAFFSCFMGIGGEPDMLSRVLDDFYQMANECADHYGELHGVATVSFDKRAFRKWRAEMEKGFALYTQLDRLMHLIGEIE